jgi:hypothetical protein
MGNIIFLQISERMRKRHTNYGFHELFESSWENIIYFEVEGRIVVTFQKYMHYMEHISWYKIVELVVPIMISLIQET